MDFLDTYSREIGMMIMGLFCFPLIILYTMKIPQNKQAGTRGIVGAIMFFSVHIGSFYGTIISILCKNLITFIIFLNIYAFSILGAWPLGWLLAQLSHLLAILKIFPPEWDFTIPQETIQEKQSKKRIKKQPKKETRKNKKM